MSTTTLSDYIAQNASLPQDVVLGHIVWFEVSEGAYDGDKLAECFDRLHLNPEYLPSPINPADAFEKASRAVEGLKYDVTLPGGATGRAEILVREVTRAGSQIVRHLIREVRDAGHKRLSFDKVGEMVYYRPKTDGNGKVDHGSARVRCGLEAALAPEERKLLTDLVARFDAEYDRFRRFHDGQKMRAVMRGYLGYLNAVLMKSSVYFVHVNRAEELAKLKAFTEEFDGLSLVLWQIPDLASHREEVVEAFQREAEKELALVLAEIQKMRETRKGDPTFEQFMRIKAKYDSVQERAGEHQRTLELVQTRTSMASEMVMRALVEFQEDVLKAEAEKAKKAS